jgi:ParB family transcriptional regulator, chromosome partitioning protein
MNTDNPRRLGRGLEALISKKPAPPVAPDITAGADSRRDPLQIPIASIRPNPFQPRKEFDPTELKELEDSLRATGLLQPITVRPSPSGGDYELAAGERRLRAATKLGWTHIPATVRALSDQELLAVALVENLQRADLNPIEEAQGYSRLTSEFGLTQLQIAERVGKDRSTIANMLRLLQLPTDIRIMLQSSSLSLGHARALLGLSSEGDQVTMAKEIALQGLSVREVEKRVRDRKPTPQPLTENRTQPQPPAKAVSPSSTHIRRIEDDLRKKLQTDVKVILSGPDKGTLNVSFYSADDLERLLDIIIGNEREPH